MNKYLSLIFLYNRAGRIKIPLAAAVIPVGFLAVFYARIGNPCEASSYLLMERGFGGFWAVLLFAAANLLGLTAVAGSLNGRKDMKASHATTGYTMRRLRLSPVSAYLTIFIYYLVLTLIFWGMAVASLFVIGRLGLTMAGAAGIDTKFALGLLRTDIGHVLLPVADPGFIVFNIVVVLALAGECAKSCYLSWHNGRPSFGAALVLIPAFLVWIHVLDDIYLFMTIVIIAGYTAVSFWDVISREKHPKGDPFKANQYAGIMDLDSFDFDDSSYVPEANRPVEGDDPEALKMALPQLYDAAKGGGRKGLRRLDVGWLRRRFMPLGIDMERANTLFGAGIVIGIAEHLVFVFRYITGLNKITSGIKGVTIASGMKMPYFWELEAHTYYGYLIGVLMVLFLQAYWNWEYYNKKTKSVYVMKRLPDKREYPRTIWTAPALQACFIVMIMAAHTVIDLCVYVLGTPELALQQDYLARILPF